MSTLYVYNSLSGKKEVFTPLHPPYVGMYVCGPTVYGDAHLGHARPAITFDVIYRYLLHLGYKVRYVRNITDVGHLENDADEGEDKIAKKARLEKLEPMEVVQHFTNRYHHCMALLNVKPPSIEPYASGHIIEQIETIKQIIANGYAYVVNGSVYFDVKKYHQTYHYGKLSGRVLEELLANTRDTEGQQEKRFPLDFALWKKAAPQHIMRWPSPWGEGFPGWHIECSVMGAKYLGLPFDIHGGGMDLLFPHHECEIAQSVAAFGKEHVRYWLHNNMVTINGQKMGKSLGNAITLYEFFSGNHPLLTRAYSPMTVRFLILQAHYRSTLDFSNESLQAAEKGLTRLMNAISAIEKIVPSQQSSFSPSVNDISAQCYQAMQDDFNTPIVIANLFEAVRIVNSIKDGKETISSADLALLKKVFNTFVFEVLGLQEEKNLFASEYLNQVMQILLAIRQEARKQKNFSLSDKIRDDLKKIGIILKDAQDTTSWEIENPIL